MMLPIRFSPEINAGAILQALILFVTIGGGAITSYVMLKADIAALAGRLAVVENHRQTDLTFQADTRAALSHVLEALSRLEGSAARETKK